MTRRLAAFGLAVIPALIVVSAVLAGGVPCSNYAEHGWLPGDRWGAGPDDVVSCDPDASAIVEDPEPSGLTVQGRHHHTEEPTSTPSTTPTATPTGTSSASPTATATPTPPATSSPTPTPTPTATPSPTPSPTPTPTPVPTPTQTLPPTDSE